MTSSSPSASEHLLLRDGPALWDPGPLGAGGQPGPGGGTLRLPGDGRWADRLKADYSVSAKIQNIKV